jgi:hypothetical protein
VVCFCAYGEDIALFNAVTPILAVRRSNLHEDLASYSSKNSQE